MPQIWYYYNTRSRTLYLSNRQVNDKYKQLTFDSEITKRWNGYFIPPWYYPIENVQTVGDTFVLPEYPPALLFGAKNLKTINVAKWDVSNVKSLSHMFDGCEALEEIVGIDTWNTSNVVNMNSMFNKCKSLTELNIPLFSISKVVNFIEMFKNCESLESIKTHNWWDNIKSRIDAGADILGDNAFLGCVKLPNYGHRDDDLFTTPLYEGIGMAKPSSEGGRFDD